MDISSINLSGAAKRALLRLRVQIQVHENMTVSDVAFSENVVFLINVALASKNIFVVDALHEFVYLLTAGQMDFFESRGVMLSSEGGALSLLAKKELEHLLVERKLAGIPASKKKIPSRIVSLPSILGGASALRAEQHLFI
ncbi:hypothetical protein QFX18_18445 [Saccharophagus degradans]|uniref:hypothetical protein n=1 Tax=Saccharophagus degradans TaxID=86304 RepID=UPI00247829A6|nr:hypothetical protein [Saccharophagus degradans]WGO97990.1 hypothetical protein QFX18_18445 [Saccharophagus degradans]